MRLRTSIVLCLLILALLAETTGVSAVPRTPGSSRVALGVASPPGRSVAHLDEFSRNMGRRPSIWVTWSQWGLPGTQRFPTKFARALAARGVTPMIWWEPVDPRNKGAATYARHRNIIRGDHDAYIREYARRAKSFGGTVLLRFAHEGNSNYFPWSVNFFDNTSRTFIAAWRHVHDIFRRQGAHNVKFVWSVAKKRCPGGCNPYRAVYPGDAYVDIVGLSNHNWGAMKGRWVPMYRGVLRASRLLRSITKKPMMIAEMGTNDQGGDKAAWIRRGYRKVTDRLPYIKAIVYLDADLRRVGHPDWSIGGKRRVMSAFADVAAMRRFRVRAPFGSPRPR